MKRALRIAGVLLLLIAVLGAGVFLALVWLGERKLERVVDVRVVPVPFVKDAASLKLGKDLYASRRCAECHGAEGQGRVFIDEPGGMFVRSPNITRAPGSVVESYSEGDWVRAIRHGVDPRGHALFAMPSEDYNRLSDSDFAALVAYVRDLPPAAGEPAAVRLPLVTKALYGAGVVKDAAEKIDHRLPPSRR